MSEQTDLWRVGDIRDLRDDDPCFELEVDAQRYALAQSLIASTTVYGIWHYEQGLAGDALPTLKWLYVDCEAFARA